MTAVLITTMLVVANVMGAGMAYPQAARLVRQRSTAGVSGVWAGVSLSMNLWWLAYGLAEGLWGLVPVSAVAAVLYGVIIVAYVRAAGRSTIPGVAAGLVRPRHGPAPVPARRRLARRRPRDRPLLRHATRARGRRGLSQP